MFLSLLYNGDKSYLYLNKTKICKFKAKDFISWYNLFLGIISKDFTKNEQSETSLNGTVNSFSVDHSSIEKDDFLNIYQYSPIFND